MQMKYFVPYLFGWYLILQMMKINCTIFWRAIGLHQMVVEQCES